MVKKIRLPPRIRRWLRPVSSDLPKVSLKKASEDMSRYGFAAQAAAEKTAFRPSPADASLRRIWAADPIDASLLFALILFLAWAPLWHGGNRPFAWGVDDVLFPGLPLRGLSSLKLALAHDEDQTMKRSRFIEEQIIGILKEHRAGVAVADLCRKHGVSDASIYKWKARYGGMDVSEAKRLKTLEDENTRLKRLLADAMLDNAALKDLLGKNGDARCRARGRRASSISLRDERAADVQGDRLLPNDGSLRGDQHGRRRPTRADEGDGARAAPVRLSPPSCPAAAGGLCGQSQAAVPPL
jgi:putative transposase